MIDHDPLASPLAPETSDLPVGPAPTEPVERDRAALHGERGRRRWRWAVAVAVVALLVAGTVAAGALLTGARSASTVARWAPADALAYGELRPDLPGDQRDQLAAFLSAFPGFSDRSILERKLTEIYDRLLSGATSGKHTYSGDIAPWFGGELGVAVGAPADLGSTAANARPPMLVVASASDGAKAIAWFRSTATEAGATLTTADAGGTQLVLASSGSETIAGAAQAGVLLVGDEASVRAALGRAGSAGLAADPSFQAAVAALPGDDLATAYVHLAAYAVLLARLPGSSGLPSPPADLATLLPAWSAVSLRATSDALGADAAAPKTAAAGTVPDGPSALPARLPATTLALMDTHGVGRALLDGLAAAQGQDRAGLDSALQRVGGLEGLVGWVGEAAVVVVPTSAGPLPGVVALATDVKGAQALGGSLANLATIAGLRAVDATYAGHTITTIDLSSLAGGLSPSVSTGLPSRLAISWTLADGLVVVGPDPAFVKAVLDTKPGASLAEAPGFKAMTGRVAASHHVLAWIDVAAARDLLAARLPAGERARYDSDIAPYLAPLSGVVGVATHDGALERAGGLLILERP